MARGVPGTDSSVQVTAELVEAATDFFGETPRFWGRYFKSPTGGSFAEYRHKSEDPVLAEAGIKVLPIGQQTKHVNRDRAQGAADAQLNVSDFLLTFPHDHLVEQGGEFFMFLDVEGDPALSTDYYTGWAQTLIDFSRSQSSNEVTLLPCVYAPQLNTTTWHALVAATTNGVPCHGAWVARYPHDRSCVIQDFDPDFAIPKVELPFDVLIWQYDEECLDGRIDLDQTNPDIEDIETALLNQLILPP